MPLPFEECPRSRSHLCCNERLASALILPPHGRGGRTPLDERDGLPVVHFHKRMDPDVQTFRESTFNSYATYSHATLLWSDWGDRQYDCMLVQEVTRRKSHRELCITLWYKKMSKYNGNGL